MLIAFVLIVFNLSSMIVHNRTGNQLGLSIHGSLALVGVDLRGLADLETSWNLLEVVPA